MQWLGYQRSTRSYVASCCLSLQGLFWLCANCHTDVGYKGVACAVFLHMQYPFPVKDTILWMADHVDLILVFFDPIGAKMLLCFETGLV